MKCTTIVIPVYNAYEHLRLCLESVKKHTIVDSQTSVVLVNDASPDARIGPLLNDYEKLGWTVLQNEINLGFPGTANRGMKHDVSADVVLLNSDVVVHKNWLENLRQVAYAEDDIGTVTALSNNASIFSWPGNTYEDNAVSIEFAQNIAEILRTNTRVPDYLEIPVGVGHCFFIRRQLIRDVGYLDEESFGVGYGEEVQLCLRARRAGYRHVLSPRAYGYHYGSASMQAIDGIEQINVQNNQKLDRDFPEFRKLREQYVGSGCSADFYAQIGQPILNELCGSRRRILLLLHNSIDCGKIGGIEYHVRELADQLRNDAAVFVLGPRDEFAWDLRLFVGEATFRFSLVGFNQQQTQVTVLDVIAPHIVHIHHIKNVPSSFLTEIFARNIPSVLTVHDYYLTCPNYCLLDEKGEYCGLPSLDSMKHATCLKASGFDDVNLAQWRSRSQWILDHVACTIFVSESAKSIFLQALSAQNVHVIGCGIATDGRWINPTSSDHEFSVCFLGVGAENKGRKFVTNVAEQLLEKKIKVHFLGSLKSDWSVSIQGSRYARFYARYRPEEAVTTLRRLKTSITCLFSPWPETFSRTLSEAWAATSPVLVSNHGALAERVNKSGAGWVLRDYEVTTAVETIIALANDPAKVQAAREKITPALYPSVEDITERMRDLYAALATNRNFGDVGRLWSYLVDSKGADWSASLPDTALGQLVFLISRPLLPGCQKTKQRYSESLSLTPEFIDVMYPDTFWGFLVGKATMTYLRVHKVGWKKALARPFGKLRAALFRRLQQTPIRD